MNTSDEKICEDTYWEIAEYLSNGQNALIPILSRMKNSSTIEEFMQAKKELMKAIVDLLPLASKHCPFCRKYGLFLSRKCCKECPYGKIHGVCIDWKRKSKKKMPDYLRLIYARGDLLNAIDNYYKGETYGRF